MASTLYNKGRQRFLEAQINWTSDTIKAVLVDAALYTVNISTHEFLSDVPVGARVATFSLANKTSLDGIADADDAYLPTVDGPESEALVLYKDTGVDTTSPLILYIDLAGDPADPVGGDALVHWNDGADKIFKL